MRPKFTYGQYGDKPYNYNNDEILHREGEWFLRKSHPDSGWKSYIHHRVEKNIVQQNPWHNGQKPVPLTYLKKIGCEWSDLPLVHNKCTKCLNTIPEGIMGLWTMHNWDALQNTNIRPMGPR